MVMQIRRDGLPTIPAQYLDKLDRAFKRYLAMVDLKPTDSGSSAEVDRLAFKEYVDHDGYGLIAVTTGSCVDFLHAVTGLPKSWCATWQYLYFAEKLRPELAGEGGGRMMKEALALALSYCQSGETVLTSAQCML